MTDANICGSIPARYRGSRGARHAGRSMRTVAQEGLAAGDNVADWRDEFIPAISQLPTDTDVPESVRRGEWFVVRFITHGERLVRRLLDHIKIPYRYPTYQLKRPRERPLIRAYLPGYAFVQMDIKCDYWQQILRIPNVIGILGSPTPVPANEFDALMATMGSHRIDEKTCNIRVGEVARILSGTFSGHSGVVQSVSSKGVATIPIEMFNRMIGVKVYSSAVELVT